MAAQLNEQGWWRGDSAYEAQGIFEVATLPRCTAAITGLTPNGTPVPGRYRSGRPYADGFDENVEFFQLSYLDADAVDLDGAVEALQPAMWLGACATGERAIDLEQPWILPEGARYGVLLQEARYRHFRKALDSNPSVSTVYLRTDSPESCAEMSDALPAHIRPQMLPRDYRLYFRAASLNSQ